MSQKGQHSVWFRPSLSNSVHFRLIPFNSVWEGFRSTPTQMRYMARFFQPTGLFAKKVSTGVAPHTGFPLCLSSQSWRSLSGLAAWKKATNSEKLHNQEEITRTYPQSQVNKTGETPKPEPQEPRSQGAGFERPSLREHWHKHAWGPQEPVNPKTLTWQNLDLTYFGGFLRVQKGTSGDPWVRVLRRSWLLATEGATLGATTSKMGFAKMKRPLKCGFWPTHFAPTQFRCWRTLEFWRLKVPNLRSALYALALQTRAPWTEVKSAHVIESCLVRAVQKVFGAEGPRVSQKVTCVWANKVCARATPCCASATSLLFLHPARHSASSPKHLGPDQLILTSVLGGLVCKVSLSTICVLFLLLIHGMCPF